MSDLTISTAVLVQILFTAYFIRANKKTVAALADVSEIAKTADRAKGIFLSRMGNAIRFPINQILNSANLLMKTHLQEQNRDTARDIEYSTLDLSEIVDKVLDVTRLDAGKITLVNEPFDIVNLLHSILRPFEYLCENTPRSISMEFQSVIPERVVGDATRLKQILRNLIGNALKFTSEGRIALRVRQDGNGIFSFELEDSGIGIPVEIEKLIFEPFFQADGSTTRKYGGTGLGLFISKELVELMGGRLEYRPAAIRGSVFRFSIKLPS